MNKRTNHSISQEEEGKEGEEEVEENKLEEEKENRS